MKEQSSLSKIFFGKKIPIERNKLNFKEIKMYE
jgi:hypothetical protein